MPLTRITRLIRSRLQPGYSPPTPLNRFTLNGFIFDRAQRNGGTEGGWSFVATPRNSRSLRGPLHERVRKGAGKKRLPKV